jgi:murein DD-endopeptidase MepM/ murein hydrolase activator NlpD
MNKIRMATFSVLLVAPFIAGWTQMTAEGNDGEEHPREDPSNDALHPCISADEYHAMEHRCAMNRMRYGIPDGPAQGAKTTTLSLEWPLRAVGSLHDCSYYRISAYVDHDTLPGSIQDWNCGTKTYDGHRGTDIATWPFNFYKMDKDLVEVVAAAPGMVIDKHDGEFDRNCSGNNRLANYVILQHTDGSKALYWHMKSGSITTTNIGEVVAVGDRLGVVGSSGSSSGPHLHFEIWSGSTMATRKDPYGGNCNLLNGSTSWWASQKPYQEAAVIRASTHSTDIVVPPCPTTETLNESNSFTIPFQGPGLSPGYAKFYAFIRDEVSGLTANFSIIAPDGGTYLSWTYNSAADAALKTLGYSKLLPTTPGTYAFRAEYNGIFCEFTFEIVGAVAADESRHNGWFIFPNPSEGKFSIRMEEAASAIFEVFDLLGTRVWLSQLTGLQTDITLDVPRGVYAYHAFSNTHPIASGRLVVE